MSHSTSYEIVLIGNALLYLNQELSEAVKNLVTKYLTCSFAPGRSNTEFQNQSSEGASPNLQLLQY